MTESEAWILIVNSAMRNIQNLCQNADADRVAFCERFADRIIEGYKKRYGQHGGEVK
jgi:hypothetical protein